MTIEVGKKYRLKEWGLDTYAELQSINDEFVEMMNNYGVRAGFDIKRFITLNWLPYKEPELDNTKLWYWEWLNNENVWVITSCRYTQTEVSAHHHKLEALGFKIKGE